MSIRNDDTVETLSPVRRRVRSAKRFVLVAILIAAVGAVVYFFVLPTATKKLSGADRPVDVAIETDPPGADVFIDEQPVGTSPARTTLAPGPHTVRIVRNGFKPWRGAFDPAEGTVLKRTLEPLELATLIVESTPDRASVFLDDEYRGVTPLTLRDIEAGPCTVRVSREPAYRSKIEQLELKAGETHRLSVQLESGLEALYEGRIAKDPKQLSNYTELIHLQVGSSQVAEAVATVTKGLKALETAEAQPDDLRRFYDETAHVYKGKAGELDAATRERILAAILVLFEKIALAKPAEPDYYRPIVQLLGQTGQWDAIVAVCDKTAKGAETQGLVHVNVAQMYLAWGDSKSAILLLERGVKLRPDSFNAHYYLASAYHRSERPDDALREYLAAEKAAGQASVYYQGRLQSGIAKLLAAKGDIDGACARYEKALALKGVSSYYVCQWRRYYAEFLVEHKRKDKAIEQYREILRLSPTSKYGSYARKALIRLGAPKSTIPR